MLSYFQAVVIGLLQGVTELFPVSSLGHSVLVPAWLGWDEIVRSQSSGESFYLAFVVALHCATALALLVYFRADWVRIVRGFFRTIRTRRVDTVDERMAWLLVIGTIPVGITGLVLEHTLRTSFAKPLPAAVFLTVNGVILLAGERFRRREARRRLEALEPQEGGLIGAAQIPALFPGISRSGITMVAGLLRGLSHEEAARFSFLLATPVIFAAGVYKLPDLLGPLGDGVRMQALVGAVFAGLASYVAVRFLVRFFETNTLVPFAVYCLLAGGISIIRFL
ncbi:MAG: uppP [Actinomycetia bacterium]|nr:uppP [Actinomycetes bacterium]